MNPFDLRGPEFLVFYLIFAASLLAAAAFLRRRNEGGPAPKLDLDPYAIAFLRGGHAEAVRVAMVSLIDRGLLSASSIRVVRAPHADPAAVRRPLEKVLLNHFATESPAVDAIGDATVKHACEPIEATLEQNGLLPNADHNAHRTVVFLMAVLLLLGVGGFKVLVAIERGRHNFGLLFIMMFVAVVGAGVVCFPRTTVRGTVMLEDLKELYNSLSVRASSIAPGGATIDALMLAAVFGLDLLPSTGFAYARTLFPQAASSSSGGDSSGSSCGSSCGGGCGGGCGGCGS